MPLEIRVIPSQALLLALTPARLLHRPVRNLMQRATIAIESEGKLQATSMRVVDTGRLRASITHQIDPAPLPLWGKAGTNLEYAPYVHGPMDGSATWGRRPGAAAPPVSAITVWARRHGTIPPFVLARSIGRRGIRARPFLLRALRTVQPRVEGFVRQCADEIVAAWGGR